MTKRKRERKTTSKDESFRKIRVVGAKKRFALLIKPNWIRLNLNISFLLALLALIALLFLLTMMSLACLACVWVLDVVNMAGG